MKFPFKQRDVPIGVAAFFLGVALTLIIYEILRKKGKEGLKSEKPTSSPNSSPAMPLPQLREWFEKMEKKSPSRKKLEVSNIGLDTNRVMAVKVISTPGMWANHAQIQPTGMEKEYRKIYSFNSKQWYPHNHTNPRAGPGVHINGGDATGITHTLGNGESKYVLVSLTNKLSPGIVPIVTARPPLVVPSPSPSPKPPLFYAGGVESVLSAIEPGWKSTSAHLSILSRTAIQNGITNIGAIRVISTPGAWANHAQIETTELNQRIGSGTMMYALPKDINTYGQWHTINHINPSAGPGTHINGGNATNIVYTTPIGTQYVFVTL